MSALSGIASKGDKSKAKFKTIDINTVYKGTSVGPQKTAGKAALVAECLKFLHHTGSLYFSLNTEVLNFSLRPKLDLND